MKLTQQSGEPCCWRAGGSIDKHLEGNTPRRSRRQAVGYLAWFSASRFKSRHGQKGRRAAAYANNKKRGLLSLQIYMRWIKTGSHLFFPNYFCNRSCHPAPNTHLLIWYCSFIQIQLVKFVGGRHACLISYKNQSFIYT